MMESNRQGFGRQARAQRRVDISSGRLIDPAKDESRAQVSAKRTFLNLTSENLKLAKLLLASVVLVVALIVLSGCASQAAGPTVDAQTPVAQNSIEIESVRITAAGHYIDLRYRVLDAQRANESLGPGVKPTLTDEKSGVVMGVPMTAKLGSLRQTRGEQRPDRSYFVLFANTAGVRSGSHVTAEIGDMKFESLIIE
jgi:hypothetical protein